MNIRLSNAIAGVFVISAFAASTLAPAHAGEFSSVISLTDHDGFNLRLTAVALGVCAVAVLIAAVLGRGGRPHAPGQRD